MRLQLIPTLFMVVLESNRGKFLESLPLNVCLSYCLSVCLSVSISPSACLSFASMSALDTFELECLYLKGLQPP